MEILDKNVNFLLNRFKTKFEIIQAIANLSRQNIHGQYDDRITLYNKALLLYKNVRSELVSMSHIATREEACAIMQFNKDKRFKITE